MGILKAHRYLKKDGRWVVFGALLMEAYLVKRLPFESLAHAESGQGHNSRRDVDVDNFFRGSLVPTNLIPPTGEETVPGASAGSDNREVALDPFNDLGNNGDTTGGGSTTDSSDVETPTESTDSTDVTTDTSDTSEVTTDSTDTTDVTDTTDTSDTSDDDHGDHGDHHDDHGDHDDDHGGGGGGGKGKD